MKHYQILEKLEGTKNADGTTKQMGIIPVLRNQNFRVSDFFIESTYKTEGNNKDYPCYLFTRQGCDFIANKFTGEKGIIFTAKYVKRFAEMEQEIKQPKQMTYVELIAAQAQVLVDMERKQQEQDKAIAQTNQRVGKLEKASTRGVYFYYFGLITYFEFLIAPLPL